MSEPTSVSPALNKTIEYILRSPLHGIVSKYHTLITLIVRKNPNITGLADSVAEDNQTVAKALTAHLRRSPFNARFSEMTTDEHRNPIQEDVDIALQTVTMIQVQSC